MASQSFIRFERSTFMKEIAVLGSTGSIGTQTMDVIRLHSDLFHASVIAAHKSIDKLREQAAEFHPHAIVITDEEAGRNFWKPMTVMRM